MEVNKKIDELQKQLDELKATVNGAAEIVVVLDRSGSMQTNRGDHEGGLRSFVEQQKKDNLNKRFTFVQFDDVDPFELIYDGVSLDLVKELSLIPRGCTPLRDAIGKTISHMESKLSGTNRDVLFLIISDGQENASKEWTRENLRNKVNEKKEAGWQFVFLGTNFDVVLAGTDTGFDFAKNVTFTNNSASIQAAYSVTGQKFSNFRVSRSAGASVMDCSEDLNYTADELSSIKDAQE